MSSESNESAFHHKKELEALVREREVLESENRVLQLKVQRANTNAKLNDAAKILTTSEGKYTENEKEKERLKDSLITECKKVLQNFSINSLEKDGVLEEFKHFVKLYIDREWNLHLRTVYGPLPEFTEKDGSSATLSNKNSDPDEGLVHDVLKDFFEYHNSILDAKGVILEKQKGPIGKKDKNVQEKLWLWLACKSGATVFGVLLIYLAIIYFLWYSEINNGWVIGGILVGPLLVAVVCRAVSVCRKESDKKKTSTIKNQADNDLSTCNPPLKLTHSKVEAPR